VGKRKRVIHALTSRQRQVLHLVVKGRSAREIGSLLNISPRTVEFHKQRMMEVLGMQSTAEGGARAEGREENRFSRELRQRRAESAKIGGRDRDRHVHVAAELGGAVEDARLPPHQERLHPVAAQGRKDFGYRARRHRCPRGAGTSPTDVRIPGSAARGITCTSDWSPGT